MKLFFVPDMFETNRLTVFSEDHDGANIGTLQELENGDWKITSPHHDKELTFGSRNAALKNLIYFAAKKLGSSKPKITNQLILNLQ